MNEDIYFDVETKLCKYKNTNELVSSECVFVLLKRLKYKGSVKEGKLNGKGIFTFQTVRNFTKAIFPTAILKVKVFYFTKTVRNITKAIFPVW